MLDALIISDIHLGSQICQTKLLQSFFQSIESGEYATKELILNGDMFDSWDFRRLGKHHWKVLSAIRSLSDRVNVIWIGGNHCGPAEVISHLIGVTVVTECMVVSNGKKILVLHGDRFDNFITNHPIITRLADFCYHVMQRIDPSFWMAKQAKKASKTFLRCVTKVKQGAIEYAKKKKCDAVCVGHTHHAEVDVESDSAVGYYNSGCWTEPPGTFIVIKDGIIEIKSLN